MGVNRSIEQGEDAFHVVVNAGGVHHGPVGDLGAFDEPFLYGSNP